MEYLKFVLYGLIQGLMEFIPVSSTQYKLPVKTKFISADKDPESVSKEKTKNNKPSLEEVKQWKTQSLLKNLKN